jgi:hypothetical protein
LARSSQILPPRSVISHLINPNGRYGGFTLKKLIALAAAGILTLSVAAFADDAAKPASTTETKSTTTEMKKDDAGAMKKTTTKKHHKKSTKKDGSKMETKTNSKSTTTEAAPNTNYLPFRQTVSAWPRGNPGPFYWQVRTIRAAIRCREGVCRARRTRLVRPARQPPPRPRLSTRLAAPRRDSRQWRPPWSYGRRGRYLERYGTRPAARRPRRTARVRLRAPRSGRARLPRIWPRFAAVPRKMKDHLRPGGRRIPRAIWDGMTKSRNRRMGLSPVSSPRGVRRPTLIEAFPSPVPQRGFGGYLPRVGRGARRHVVPTRASEASPTKTAGCPNPYIGSGRAPRAVPSATAAHHLIFVY